MQRKPRFKGTDYPRLKVALWGLGVSNLSAFNLLQKLSAQLTVVSTGEPHKWKHYPSVKSLGETQLFTDADPRVSEVFQRSDLIILSPGIAREHPHLEVARNLGVPIWTEIELAYQILLTENRPLPEIYAITGTNGKTTTVTLLAHLLEEGLNHKAFLGGNIGLPFCEYVLTPRNDRANSVILEMSSFQCESLEEFKPTAAGLINLSFSHGERYHHLEDYAGAKLNLIKRMGPEDPVILSPDFRKPSSAHKILPIPRFQDLTEAKASLCKWTDPNHIHLIGLHNYENLWVALTLIEQVRGSLHQHKEGINQALEDFKSMEHRIELVGSHAELVVYNDSKSTNIDSTLKALAALEAEHGSWAHESVYLILGGKLRGEDPSFKEHIPILKKFIKKIFLIGEATQTLFEDLSGSFQCERSQTLEKVFESLKKDKPQKGIVLFSPSYPSFDQFESYGERGKRFKAMTIDFLCP